NLHLTLFIRANQTDRAEAHLPHGRRGRQKNAWSQEHRGSKRACHRAGRQKVYCQLSSSRPVLSRRPGAKNQRRFRNAQARTQKDRPLTPTSCQSPLRLLCYSDATVQPLLMASESWFCILVPLSIPHCSG